MPNLARFPSEVVLRPSAVAALPADMAASGRVYAVEAPLGGTGILRICSSPDGSGRHTTVRLVDLDLKATAALSDWS